MHANSRDINDGLHTKLIPMAYAMVIELALCCVEHWKGTSIPPIGAPRAHMHAGAAAVDSTKKPSASGSSCSGCDASVTVTGDAIGIVVLKPRGPSAR